MQRHLLFFLVSISLTACAKADEPPRGIQAAFEQSFELFYKQKASLDNVTAPELTVKIDQLEYYTTPDNILCCFGPCAWWKATVLVTDAAGNTQAYTRKPYSYSYANNNATWLDSLHVRANNTAYIIYLEAMKPGLEDKKTKVQHRSVQLVVSRSKEL